MCHKIRSQFTSVSATEEQRKRQWCLLDATFDDVELALDSTTAQAF